jgi:uncharacterized protein
MQLFRAICTWVASAASLFFVPLVLVMPYMIYKIAGQGLTPESLRGNKTIIVLSILGVIPAHVLSVFIAWALVTSWGKRPFWETIKWSWPEDFGARKKTLLVLSAIALLALGSWITNRFGGNETEIDLLIKSSNAARIITAFLAAGTAPFVEELVYRGVLYPAFERSFGMVWAVLVVSVLFAGVHVIQYWNNISVIAVIAMLSVSLTLVRAFTRRLLPSFVMHLVFNGIQAIFIVLAPYIESPPHTDKVSATGLLIINSVVRHIG